MQDIRCHQPALRLGSCDTCDTTRAQVSGQVQGMLAARPGDFQVFFDAFMVVAFRAEVMDGTVSVVRSAVIICRV